MHLKDGSPEVTGFTVSALYDVKLREGEVAISETSEKAVSAFPNPTTGIVTVSTASEIQVFNMHGALLQKTFGTQVDLSAYPSGVYQLRVNGKAVQVVKQ